MPHRSSLVVASAALLLAGAPRARAETAPSIPQERIPQARIAQERASTAELAAGACRLGRWSAAAALLREVERQQRRPEDWLCLARAQFHTGQWVAALDSYDELVESAPSSRTTKAVGAVERRELEQRLGWLQIVTSAALSASVSLRLDGEAIPPSRVGVAFPVQPGSHALSIEVGGEVRQVDHWRIAQGQHRTIGLSIPTELPAPKPAHERAVAPDEAVLRQPKPVHGLSGFRMEPSSLQRWAKGTVIGGGLTIAGGVGLLWLAAGTHSRGLGYAGVACGILGGAGLMTGASLYVAGEMARPEPSEAPLAPPQRLKVEPWILSDGAGTGISGSF